MDNPNELDTKELKKLLTEKPDTKKQIKVTDHPKYRELVKLIQEAKNGNNAQKYELYLYNN